MIERYTCPCGKSRAVGSTQTQCRECGQAMDVPIAAMYAQGSPSRVVCRACGAVIGWPCADDGRSWSYCRERTDDLRALLVTRPIAPPSDPHIQQPRRRRRGKR